MALFPNEQKHPFYQPLWRRVAIVAIIALWLALELFRGSEWFWSALAGGMLVYAVNAFFLTWPKDAPKDDAGPDA